MKSIPKISIVVPSFNQGQFIGETLESLITQQYPNLELIIIDGGSTDNTVAVIEHYAPYITYWVSEKDNGQTHAINKGLAHVTGDIFNWLNSDDVLEPGSLHHLAQLYNQYPTKNLFIGKTRFFDLNGTMRNSTPIVYKSTATTLGYGQVNQPAMFYKTTALTKLLPLDDNLHMCMDLDLWTRYLLNFGQDAICQSECVLAGFRFHGDSKTMSAANPFRKERDVLYEKLMSKHHNNEVVQSAMPYYYLWYADELLGAKDFINSKKLLKKVNIFCLNSQGLRLYFGVYRRLVLHT
ncbi:MAG: glycosyltransferase [Bacteroidetes bacterium]|jgi:glycosyltransferase involved in cell wall biosynthesis|nr:glycosyltransferase [Bacteroidota bacterium]